MIGDSYQVDILGAINVGVNAILFNYHNIDPNDNIISVNNLSDLSSYL
jgi:putative hydrolase of the HAD superfamily